MRNRPAICILYFLTFVPLLLSACSTSKVSLSQSISQYSEESLITAKDIEKKTENPMFSDLLGESTAVFAVYTTDSIPMRSAEVLYDKISSRVNDSRLFSSVLLPHKVHEKLQLNSELAQVKEVYIETLTTVSVSDKDISNPLGAYLNVTNFIVFMVDKWPCFDCAETGNLRMKLQLVDTQTGLIIWTAIAEQSNLKPEELEMIEEVANRLASRLTDSLYDTFKKKWHHKRYENLSRSTG